MSECMQKCTKLKETTIKTNFLFTRAIMAESWVVVLVVVVVEMVVVTAIVGGAFWFPSLHQAKQRMRRFLFFTLEWY